MSRGLISIILAGGAGTWIYTKFQKYSGNNTQQSAIGAGICAILIFIFAFTILGLVL